MKTRSGIAAVCIGLIILSAYMLTKEPAYGASNQGMFCTFMKNSAPLLMFLSCILILFTATRLRILSIVGIVLIIGSLVATYFLGESSGHSMGTSGWASGFVGALLVIPVGLILCGITGVFSLVDMLHKDTAAKKPVIVSAGVILALGITYHVVADWKPNIGVLVEAIKSDENEYKRFLVGSRLSEIQDEKLPPLLIPLLEDRNPRVREAAALALGGKSKNATIVKPLLMALYRETDKNASEWIIRSLGRIAPVAEAAEKSEIIGTLIRNLKSGKDSVKGTAAQSLGMIKDDRVLQPLIDALPDQDAGFYAHEALLRVTGEHFDSNPDTWNKWMKKRVGKARVKHQ